MSFKRSLWLTSLLGLSACAVGCKHAVIVATEPYYCEPFYVSDSRVEQYVEMYKADAYPAVRAWVREADRACEANNALRGEYPDVE